MDYFEGKCTYCTKNFTSDVAMKKHEFTAHFVDTIAHDCDECEKSFSSHKVKSFFESRPNYNHQNKTTLASGEATLAGIVHFNSVNI